MTWQRKISMWHHQQRSVLWWQAEDGQGLPATGGSWEHPPLGFTKDRDNILPHPNLLFCLWHCSLTNFCCIKWFHSWKFCTATTENSNRRWRITFKLDLGFCEHSPHLSLFRIENVIPTIPEMEMLGLSWVSWCPSFLCQIKKEAHCLITGV